jgi:hypothetical protein
VNTAGDDSGCESAVEIMSVSFAVARAFRERGRRRVLRRDRTGAAEGVHQIKPLFCGEGGRIQFCAFAISMETNARPPTVVQRGGSRFPRRDSGARWARVH